MIRLAADTVVITVEVVPETRIAGVNWRCARSARFGAISERALLVVRAHDGFAAAGLGRCVTNRLVARRLFLDGQSRRRT